VSGRPGHIHVFIGQGDLDQVEDWLESGHVSVLGEDPEHHHNLSPGFNGMVTSQIDLRKACLLSPAAGIFYSVKCKIRFPATLIYCADCLFQSTKALFVVGTDDFSKNMGEVLEQFHRPAAQYPTLFCPHDLDL
jgi:hypothetical protein